MTSQAISIRIGSTRYIIAPRNSVAPELLHHIISPADELHRCLSDPVAMQELRGLLLHVDLLPALDHLSNIEVIARISELARGSFARLIMIRAADTLGSANGPRPVLDTFTNTVRPDLSITAEEERFLRAKDIRAFWLSRLHKLDPIARIGFGLWSQSADEYRAAIDSGNPDYWDHKGFAYWESMVRSTVVNLSAGLNRAGFRGNMRQEREKIRAVGLRVAEYHADFVQEDYDSRYGNVPGLLSTRQIADYHHKAFADFGIQPHYYGGTWLESVPDQAEFRIYGMLYCHDCDTDTGYPAPGGR